VQECLTHKNIHPNKEDCLRPQYNQAHLLLQTGKQILTCFRIFHITVPLLQISNILKFDGYAFWLRTITSLSEKWPIWLLDLLVYLVYTSINRSRSYPEGIKYLG